MFPASIMPPPPDPQDDPAERKARHLARARELQDLAMAVARAAAAKAVETIQAPDPEPPEEPGIRAPRIPDHALAFARAARIAQSAMAFENRVATGDEPRAGKSYRVADPNRAASLLTPPDPRRQLVRIAFKNAVNIGHDLPRRERNELDREIDSQIDAKIRDDPDRTIKALDVLRAIVDEYGLSINPAKLSDEILGIPPRKFTPDQLNL